MMHEPEKYVKIRKNDVHEPEKSNGNGILIVGGLIIGGIIIAMILKAKAKPTSSTLSDSSMIILQERIVQLEQQLASPALVTVDRGADRGGPSSQGFGFELPTGQPLPLPLPLPLSPQNLIFNKDGSMTDADVMQGEKYKNKESWSIKRDEDGAITGIDVERNASVGSNNAT